jgi:hypothetical protein
MIGSLGKDAVAAAESYLSLIQPVIISIVVLSNLNSSNFSLALLTSHNDATCNTWLLNSGATDNVTLMPQISLIYLPYTAPTLPMQMVLFHQSLERALGLYLYPCIYPILYLFHHYHIN